MDRNRSITVLLDTWFLAQSVTRWMQVHLSSVGFSADEMALCSVIAAVGDASPTTLSEVTGSPLSTMTSMIARLQRGGVVETVPDTRDRRSKLVRLTDSGQATLSEAQAAFAPAYRELIASLSVSVEQIGATLNELEAAVRADLGLTQRAGSLTLTASPGDEALPLSGEQLAEVGRYVSWIRHRDSVSQEKAP